VAKTHVIKTKGLLNIVKFFEESGYKIDRMKMHLVFVTPKKENVSPQEQMTNHQKTTRNDKSIVISRTEDNRIIKIFQNQAQLLTYFITENE